MMILESILEHRLFIPWSDTCLHDTVYLFLNEKKPGPIHLPIDIRQASDMLIQAEHRRPLSGLVPSLQENYAHRADCAALPP